MYQSINLNTLKYFTEVANIKNITKASKNLNISQPALTKAINQLEHELNSKLFVRSKKGVSLTSEGEIINHPALKVQGLNGCLKSIIC